MTIEKITRSYTDWNQRIFGDKINELVDVVNSLTGGEKEKCSDPRGNELCTDGINTYHQFNTTEPGYKCPYCNQKAPKKLEPKSNTLRDTLVIKYGGITNDKYLMQEILSLVKEHLKNDIVRYDLLEMWDVKNFRKSINEIIENL